MPQAFTALAKFARLLADAPTSVEIRQLLVDTAPELAQCAAAVLVELDAHGAPSVSAQNGCAEAVGLALSDDVNGFAPQIVAASGGRFTRAEQIPLVAGGDLYGMLVLLNQSSEALSEQQSSLVGAAIDIVAATLARAKQSEELAAALEQLGESRRALVQAEKLRALGGMAAGIAHDLKNVFAPLLMQHDILAGMKDADAAFLMEHIGEMRRPLENGLRIVDRLRVFSRPLGDDGKELAELRVIVEDAVGLARPRASQSAAHVDIVTRHADAPVVRVETADMVAAVTNLVMNAVDALSTKGGTITVSTGTGDGGAFVTVADDGPGLSPEARARLFEPFFTTKGKQGTGLGLAMVKETAQRHAGSITLESNGEGARFTLWLPAAR